MTVQPHAVPAIAEQIGRLCALAHWIDLEVGAVNDCWVEGPVLFEIEAAAKLEYVQHLLESTKAEIYEAIRFLRKEIGKP